MSHADNIQLADTNAKPGQSPDLQCIYVSDARTHTFRHIRVGDHSDHRVFTYCGVLHAAVYNSTADVRIWFDPSPADAAATSELCYSAHFLPSLTVTDRCMACLFATLACINREDSKQPKKTRLLWHKEASTPEPLFLATFGFQVCEEKEFLQAAILDQPLADTLATMRANSIAEYARRGLDHTPIEQSLQMRSPSDTNILDGFSVDYDDTGPSRITSPCIHIHFTAASIWLESFMLCTKAEVAKLYEQLGDFCTHDADGSEVPYVARAMVLVLRLVKWGLRTRGKTSGVLSASDAWMSNKPKPNSLSFTSEDLIDTEFARHRHGYYTRFGFWPKSRHGHTVQRDVFCAWSDTDELVYCESLAQRHGPHRNSQNIGDYARAQKEQWGGWRDDTHHANRLSARCV